MKGTQWMFQPQVSNRNNKVMLVCVHTAEGTYRNSSKSENDMNIIFFNISKYRAYIVYYTIRWK